MVNVQEVGQNRHLLDVVVAKNNLAHQTATVVAIEGVGAGVQRGCFLRRPGQQQAIPAELAVDGDGARLNLLVERVAENGRQRRIAAAPVGRAGLEEQRRRPGHERNVSGQSTFGARGEQPLHAGDHCGVR